MSIYPDGKFPTTGSTKYYLSAPGILQEGSYTTNYSPNTTGDKTLIHIIVKSPDLNKSVVMFNKAIASYPCINNRSGPGCQNSKYYLKYKLTPFPSSTSGGSRTRKIKVYTENKKDDIHYSRKRARSPE